MHPAGEPLSVELLQAYERALRDAGAPITGRLRPGISDDEIDTTSAPLGLPISDEARLWWRWHDGVAAPFDRSVGDWWPLRLADAVSDTLTWREDADRDPVITWRDDWLAFCGSASYYRLALQCRPQGTTSGVADVDPMRDLVVLPSIGALVRLWLQAVEDGFYFIDASGFIGYRSPDEMENYGGAWADFL